MKYLTLILVTFLVSCATTYEKSVLTYEDTKKIGTVLHTDNLSALKAIIAKLPADKKQRSSSDQNLINKALIQVASKGINCNVAMADYLISEGGQAHYYIISKNDDNLPGSEYRTFKIPMCKNYLISTHLEYISATAPTHYKSQDEYQKAIKENFIVESYEYFISFINNLIFLNEAEFSAGLNSYQKIQDLAVKYGKEICAKSATDTGCLEFDYYKKLPALLEEKNNLNKKSKPYKLVKDFADHLKKSLN